MMLTAHLFTSATPPAEITIDDIYPAPYLTISLTLTAHLLTLGPPAYPVDRAPTCRGSQRGLAAAARLRAAVVIVVVDVAARRLDHRRATRASAVPRPDEHAAATRPAPAAARRPRPQLGDDAVAPTRQPAEPLAGRPIARPPARGRVVVAVGRRVGGGGGGIVADVTTSDVAPLHAVQRQLLQQCPPANLYALLGFYPQ